MSNDLVFILRAEFPDYKTVDDFLNKNKKGSDIFNTLSDGSHILDMADLQYAFKNNEKITCKKKATCTLYIYYEQETGQFIYSIVKGVIKDE